MIEKLCFKDGRTLRCDQPALPAEDRLFVNCRLKENSAVRGTFSVSDVPGFPEGLYLAYYICSGCRVVGRDQLLNLSLDSLDYELVTFSPLIRGAAPIGLVKKLNPKAVTVDVEDADFSFEENQICIILPEGREYTLHLFVE